MVVRVAINGYGRIGRLTHRAMVESGRTDIEVVAINDLGKPIDNARLLKYDSVHGRFKGEVSADDNSLTVNGHKIQVFAEKDPANLPWKALNIDVVMECTGIFTSKEKAMVHINAGAKQVLVSAPAKEADKTIVFGVNSNTLDGSERVVSNASCTTNCLAPLVKVIQQRFGIEQGLMSTIHAATSKQKPVDSRAGRDWRTGRSLMGNIIPSTTGAAKAVARVIPELKGKLTGMSFRVPCNDVSVVDLTARLSTPTSYKEICAAVREASETTMKGIIGYTEDQLVSADIVGNFNTCVFDSSAGIMLDDNFVKLIAWYDNEWGYSAKVLELIEHMYNTDHEAIRPATVEEDLR